ncbi:MAG: hypothetical protein NVSMB64_20040 [Candidatus Velthaea sp.]
MIFPLNQLATQKQADDLRPKLNALGGGIVDIFLPDWMGGPAAFQQPSYVDPDGQQFFFLHFRYANGFVQNVALAANALARYGEAYAIPYILKPEIEAAR